MKPPLSKRAMNCFLLPAPNISVPLLANCANWINPTSASCWQAGAISAIGLPACWKIRAIRSKSSKRTMPAPPNLPNGLDKTIVLEGDAADESLLAEENIENTDVFIAITNDDEANILSSMLAKRLGAKRVMCLINRLSYIDLVESSIWPATCWTTPASGRRAG